MIYKFAGGGPVTYVKGVVEETGTCSPGEPYPLLWRKPRGGHKGPEST